jgi:hypothetical protein
MSMTPAPATPTIDVATLHSRAAGGAILLVASIAGSIRLRRSPGSSSDPRSGSAGGGDGSALLLEIRDIAVMARSIFKTCQLRRTIRGNRAVRLCRASDVGVTLESVFASDSGATRSSTSKKEECHGWKD